MYIKKIAQTPELQATVIDNLDSDSNVNALSAKQGKLLNEKIGTVSEVPMDGIIAFEGDEIPEGFEEVQYDDIKVSATEPTTKERVWLKQGKNLFNKNELILKNHYLNNEGVAVPSNGCYIQDSFIAVTPNTDYTLHCAINTGLRIVSYDKNKEFIIRETDNSGALTITTANNCYFIKLSWDGDTDTINTIQFEKGNTATAYEEYVPKEILIKNNIGKYDSFYKEDIITSLKNNKQDVKKVTHSLYTRGWRRIAYTAAAQSNCIMSLMTSWSNKQPMGVLVSLLTVHQKANIKLIQKLLVDTASSPVYHFTSLRIQYDATNSVFYLDLFYNQDNLTNYLTKEIIAPDSNWILLPDNEAPTEFTTVAEINLQTTN